MFSSHFQSLSMDIYQDLCGVSDLNACRKARVLKCRLIWKALRFLSWNGSSNCIGQIRSIFARNKRMPKTNIVSDGKMRESEFQVLWRLFQKERNCTQRLFCVRVRWSVYFLPKICENSQEPLKRLWRLLCHCLP